MHKWHLLVMNNIDVWIVNNKHIINMYMKLNNEKN
jgi:hypothetical protein